MWMFSTRLIFVELAVFKKGLFMKRTTLFLLAIATTACVVGCGKYEKNPVQDLDQMREQGKNEVNKGPDKPQILTETVIVEKPVEVVKEQATLDENFIVITADPEINFVEGQKASFQVIGRSLIKGVGIKLVAQSLPAGAVFESAATTQDKDRYLLTWTPEYNTVPDKSAIKSIKIKIAAQITEVPKDKDRKSLEALVREKEVTILVLKNQAAPTDLSVNISEQVVENTLAPFEVTVKVPGVDNKSAQKPRLVISYDGVSLTTGNDYLERDGSRHIIAAQNHKDAEYLGNYTWKYFLIFDTQNIGVQPALATNGTVQATANSSHVRLSFKVYSPLGTSTPELVKKVQIALLKPVTAPRFDLSGLGQETLQLSPGDKINFKFFVSAADPESSVKVELPSIKSVGLPKLTCKVSTLTTAKQDCQLVWNIPCSAKESDLTQELKMSAVSIADGRGSETVEQILKTTYVKKEDLCVVKPAVVKPAAKPATKPVVKSAAQPAAKSATPSVAKPAVKPAAKPVAKSPSTPTTKPTVKTPTTTPATPAKTTAEVVGVNNENL